MPLLAWSLLTTDILPPVTVAAPVVSAAAGPEGTAGTTFARRRTTAVASAVDTRFGSQAPVPFVQPRETISSMLGSPPGPIRTPKRPSFPSVARIVLTALGHSHVACPAASIRQPDRTFVEAVRAGGAKHPTPPAQLPLVPGCRLPYRSRKLPPAPAAAAAGAHDEAEASSTCSLSLPRAHSAPASANSNALVARYWLAEVRCSKMKVRFAKNASTVPARSSISATNKEAAPRW